MRTGFVRRWARLVVPIATAAGVALAAATAGPGRAEAEAAAKQQRVIATAASTGFRVRVTATRERQPDRPDAATIRIAAFERSGGDWHRLGRPRVIGGPSAWLWRVVSRPFGVRNITLARPGGTSFPAVISIRFLVSPSAGPSATFRFVVDRGRLVPVDV
jgi:hypothetical protein